MVINDAYSALQV